MIDYFALALTHALILIAILRVLMRDELDREDPPGVKPDGTKATRRQARRARRGQRGVRDA